MEDKNRSSKFLIPAISLVLLIGAVSAHAESWKFGVMSDTQWTTTDPAGLNPNAVSASVIQQINRQFVNQGVKFVIQVGDLTENGNDADIAQRAVAAQPLIDAGIGFFPMRGNHETYANPPNNFGIPAFQRNFPQTQNGKFTTTSGRTYTLGRFFRSPVYLSQDLLGMSYTFDFGDVANTARFVIIDPWVTPTRNIAAAGYNYGYSIADQLLWLRLAFDRLFNATPQHTFVFSHQPVMAENHQDSPFVGYTDANPAMQNDFFATLARYNVDYYISGHDHIHQRSLVASPDGTSQIEELICASDSSKFYTPKNLSDANWKGQKTRETSISQERYTLGFYIFTIDGPCVTVEYYSDDHGNWASDNCYPDGTTPQSCSTPGSHVTPVLNFVKKETWGYCQNGQEFLVPQGASYTTVQSASGSTGARILEGKNNSTATDYNGRAFQKAVSTGWYSEYTLSQPDVRLASNILNLLGMADLGNPQTDTYTLSMTYDSTASGNLALVAKNNMGNWVNAVDMNFGGMKKFVTGPYVPGSPLGTYGFDPSTRTVWAVINYNGSFAAGILQ